MESQEYEKIYFLEDRHWWYVGLRELLVSFLGKISVGSMILDAGCGTGATLATLSTLGVCYGIDISETALHKCIHRNLPRLVQASVTKIPFRDDSFDFVVCLDVLYHRSVENELTAVKEFYRLLKPSGKLIMNLPAFAFLRSAHDDAIHTKRRFTRSEVDRMLRDAGFQIEKLSYRVFFLFPLITLWKIFRSRFRIRADASDLRSVSDPINAVLLTILRWESRLLKRANLPFGSSVFCVAVKPGLKT